MRNPPSTAALFASRDATDGGRVTRVVHVVRSTAESGLGACAVRFVTFSIRPATPLGGAGGGSGGIAFNGRRSGGDREVRAEGKWQMTRMGRSLGRAWRVGAVVRGLTLTMAGSA